jgi:hypothetical protein
MSANSTLPPGNPQEDPQKNDTVPVKIFGLEIPVPHWAVRILAVFVVIFVPVFLLIFAIQNESLAKTKKDLDRVNSQLVKAIDTYDEITKHSGEQGDWVHKDDDLIVTHYASDGCVSVLRMQAGQAGEPQWNKDPARAGQQPQAPGAVDGGKEAELTIPNELVPTAKNNPYRFKPPNAGTVAQLRTIELNVTSALEMQPGFFTAAVLPASGRCLNPHPGKFKSWSGKVQGCWMQVWRRWDDGCTHYQWFNTCASTWDADAHGKPRLYWTVCNH